MYKVHHIDNYRIIVKTKRSYIRCSTNVDYWVVNSLKGGTCLVSGKFEWTDAEHCIEKQDPQERGRDVAMIELSLLRLLTDDV